MLPLEAVPNVSEGRDRGRIDELAQAFSRRARLLDVHSDPDHNRTVLTLAGGEPELVDSLVEGVAAARELIDLRLHEGVHPRIGAVDVVPLVPLRPEDMDRAGAAALEVAERVAREVGLPVFLYGAVGQGRRPAFFRQGGLHDLEHRLETGEVTPDHGPAHLDPAAGGVMIGARPPLVAYNVDLQTDDVDVAREIAAVVRESGGGFAGVRALGLRLPRSQRVQVSMNIEDWRSSPPHEVVARIRVEARARGVEVGPGELVGLLPAGAAAAAARDALLLPDLDSRRLLEPRALGIT